MTKEQCQKKVEANRQWRKANPERARAAAKRAGARYKLKQELSGIPRKRVTNDERAKASRQKYIAAHRERYLKLAREANRRTKEGTRGIFTCSTPACPFRVKTRLTKCLKCLAELAHPPAMTMHDRAIGISDFYRTDGSLPPLHTIKSRAKNGVQWTQ